MDFFHYISFAEPDKALRVYRSYSDQRISNSKELSDALRQLIRNLDSTDKKELLSKLADIHPDRELISETTEIVESDLNDNYKGHNCNCEHCNFKMGANGQNAVSHFMGSGEVMNMMGTNDQTTEDIKLIKAENNTKKLLNERIFQLVMVSAIGFLLYKYLKK